MSDFQLSSKRDAEFSLAKTLLQQNSGNDNLVLHLQVREDKCFANKWITVGKVQLFPESYMASAEDTITNFQRIIMAIRLGFFEWSVPRQIELVDKIKSALPGKTKRRFLKRRKQYHILQCGVV